MAWLHAEEGSEMRRPCLRFSRRRLKIWMFDVVRGLNACRKKDGRDRLCLISLPLLISSMATDDRLGKYAYKMLNNNLARVRRTGSAFTKDLNGGDVLSLP